MRLDSSRRRIPSTRREFSAMALTKSASAIFSEKTAGKYNFRIDTVECDCVRVRPLRALYRSPFRPISFKAAFLERQGLFMATAPIGKF